MIKATVAYSTSAAADPQAAVTLTYLFI